MTEIPVKHKLKATDRRFIPIWALAIVALLIIGGVIFGLRSGGNKDRADNTGAAAVSRPCGGDGDCQNRQLCLNAVCVDIKPGLPECAEVKVHFDTGSAELRDADTQKVQRMARCLKADQAMKLAIVGNADERGPELQNLELGEKRAMAVARALRDSGVSAQQLSIASYGENRPLCAESDRDCWQKNRQASLTPKPGAEVER